MQHAESFLRLVNDAKSRIREVSVASVREKLKGGQSLHFVDIREDHEWSRGRAEDAVHLGKGIIERDIEALAPDPEDEIILYCGGGVPVGAVCRRLAAYGLPKRVLHGGRLQGVGDVRESGHRSLARNSHRRAGCLRVHDP